MTDLRVAPYDVLNVVRCNCEAGCASTSCNMCDVSPRVITAIVKHCSPNGAIVEAYQNGVGNDIDSMNDWDVTDEEVAYREYFGIFWTACEKN